LVVPDPEDPATHIWAEGTDWEESTRLTEGFVERLRQIVS
jgi:hypothetical protein